MALRDFHPLNERYIQPTTYPITEAVDSPETSNLTFDKPVAGIAHSFVEPDVEPALPATQSLALRMEKARQQLLELLLQNPLAVELLSAHLSNASGEGVDYMLWEQNKTDADIVQDNGFVQLTDDPMHHHKPSSMHFFPALLIQIAEQIQTMPCDELGCKTKLVACLRNLRDTRQQMISSNTGLVAFVAYKHKTTSLGFDDLMQEGIIGLIRAVDRFDPNRGIRFSTYAIFWIKQAISRLIVKQEKVVRLPIALAEKAPVVLEAMRSCYLEHNRWPSQSELQAQCNLSLEEVKTISSYYQAIHSLDASLSDENDDQTLMMTLKQYQFALPLNELIDKNLCLYLGKVVASLPEKEADILNMRFGLKNHTEMTLQAIADQLHVTRERVRQIQNQALKKLKQQFGYDLMPFLEPNDS